MGPFAIFALILIGVYWIARAIGLFDQMIGDGQSVGVFFEIMVLFLPQVVAIVLPVVSFASAIYVSNRLHSESEMVVLQAAGITPWRLLRPFFLFGLLVTLLSGALSHYLVPASSARLELRQHELAQDMATRLIVGGKFIHPAENVTFFVREIKDDGSLVDIFLYDQRPEGRDVTYTAHKAVLLRSDENARLVMFEGLIQTFDEENLLLTKIQFDEFVFDVATLIGSRDAQPRKLQEYSTLALLFPDAELLRETGVSAEAARLEAHMRIELPLPTLVYPMIGMAVLLLGSFSRFGVLRQVLAAVALVVTLNMLSIPLRGIVRKDEALWGLLYLPDLVGFLAVYVMMRISALRGRGKVRATVAPQGAMA